MMMDDKYYYSGNDRMILERVDAKENLAGDKIVYDDINARCGDLLADAMNAMDSTGKLLKGMIENQDDKLTRFIRRVWEPQKIQEFALELLGDEQAAITSALTAAASQVLASECCSCGNPSEKLEDHDEFCANVVAERCAAISRGEDK